MMQVNEETRISLMRFDVSSLFKKYKKINSITLRLYSKNAPKQGTIHAHRLSIANSAWREEEIVEAIISAATDTKSLGCISLIMEGSHLPHRAGLVAPLGLRHLESIITKKLWDLRKIPNPKLTSI